MFRDDVDDVDDDVDVDDDNCNFSVVVLRRWWENGVIAENGGCSHLTEEFSFLK
jgi:hypothetical protein